MSKMEYSLEAGGTKRLEMSYEGNFNNCKIRLDGNEIGSIANFGDLRAGREFSLPDGSMLQIQLIKHFIFPYIQILRNGRILPSAQDDAAKMLGYAYKFIFLIGGVSFAIGLVGILRLPLKIVPAGGWLSLLAGIVFIILGFLVTRRSIIALTIAAGLFAIGTLTVIFWHPGMSGWGVALSTIFRIFLLFGIIQGYSAIKVLNINQAINDPVE